jgi:nucleotide-binding universal stress UspA family protein
MPYNPIERWEWEGGAIIPPNDGTEHGELAQPVRERKEPIAVFGRTIPVRRIVSAVNGERTIVCGIDHSQGARAAARYAADLADRLDLRAVLVYVVQPPISQSELGMAARKTDWDVVDELRHAGADLLEEVARDIGRRREIVAELKFGDPSNMIAAVAEQSGAELVVVGSRGLGSVGALILGSVSLRLAVHGPCPTVIVPASGDHPIGDRPIMCAVDDSEESRAAVATAAILADRLHVNLLLAHAKPDNARASSGEELLASLVVECGLGTSVERMVVPGEPAEAIVGSAIARDAGMIVIGSRGRGALASAALGSVSSAVASRAPCPVTIVRASHMSTSG